MHARVLVLLVVVGCGPKLPPAGPDPGPGWYVTENYYFAKRGMEEEVVKTRTEVSAAIAALGLPAGTVLPGPGGEGPTVIWQSAPYRDVGEATTVSKKFIADPRFKAAYDHMSTLLRHFERRRYVIMVWQRDPAE
jgi:hypothetical protein